MVATGFHCAENGDFAEQSCVELNVNGQGPTAFVWDLDETLIIFQTLSDGRYAELFDGFKDSQCWANLLGRRWERLISEVCDEHVSTSRLGANSLKSPLNADDLRRLRYLHLYIRQPYEQGPQTLLSPKQAKEWANLYEATESYVYWWLALCSKMFGVSSDTREPKGRGASATG